MSEEKFIHRVQIDGPDAFVVVERARQVTLSTPSGQRIELTVREDGKVWITSDGKPPKYDRVGFGKRELGVV